MKKFAFIIHPLSYEDITKRLGWTKYFPKSIVLNLFKQKKPFIASKIEGVVSDFSGEEIEGMFIVCPLTSEQMVNLPLDYVYNKITEAGELAQKNGASIVGLGAFTSVVGDGGITIRDRLNIAVTTGNSYTVYSAIEGTFKALSLMEVEPEESILAIVGAAGSIGKASALLMGSKFKKIVLIGRDKNKLDELCQTINEPSWNIEVTTSVLEGIKDADAIVAVSSAVHQVIEPNMLKPGAVICDVARPRDVSIEVAKKRDDVLVIEGGVIKVPGKPLFNYNFGFPPGLAYACMSETMILTFEGNFSKFSLGKNLELDKIIEIGKLADKHGFKLAGFRSFEKVVDPEDIERIKLNAFRNRRK